MSAFADAHGKRGNLQVAFPTRNPSREVTFLAVPRGDRTSACPKYVPNCCSPKLAFGDGKREWPG